MMGIFRLINWLVWLWQGKPMVNYDGFNCGCCGKWVWHQYSVPTYKSDGSWWDTWDLCNDCLVGRV